MEENNSQLDHAMTMVDRRNSFYRGKYYATFSIFVLCLIVIIILSSILFYLIENPTRPIYFITDSVSRLLQDVPDTEPNMSADEVAKWTIQAVQAAYSFDFVNYHGQLQKAQEYFSEYGWRNFMKGLVASNNLVGLTERQLVFIANVVGPPKLVMQGILGGAYAWKLQMPLLVKILQPPSYDEKTSYRNAYIVDVIVQRQNFLASDQGLAILQLIAKAPPPNTQSMAMPEGAPQ